MNLNPAIDLIGQIISLYNLVLIVWIVVSWLIYFNIVNKYQPFIRKLMYALAKLVEPVLNYIRSFIPPIGGIDLSAIVLFLALDFIKNALYTYFYKL
ncbi:MAG: YggT family protein [Rickettsiales endosymbiont of Dermacentor nuttalli]